jgi:hypothetical protein
MMISQQIDFRKTSLRNHLADLVTQQRRFVMSGIPQKRSQVEVFVQRTQTMLQPIVQLVVARGRLKTENIAVLGQR